MAYYYPQMLAGAGVSSVDTELLLQGILGICGLTGTVAGALLTDRIRRRTQLITGSVMNAVLLTIATVLNATNIHKTADEFVAKSEATALVQIVFLCLFIFCFGAGWTANQTLYPIECLRFETRAKGLSFYVVCLIFAFLYIYKRDPSLTLYHSLLAILRLSIPPLLLELRSLVLDGNTTLSLLSGISVQFLLFFSSFLKLVGAR